MPASLSVPYSSTEVKPDESDDYYRDLIANLPAPIYTCDLDGYIKFYNKAAADLWGREPEIGKELLCGSWKIYNADGTVMPLHQCPMAITLKEKRPVLNEEVIIERPDGEKRVIVPYPQPIYNGSGIMIGAMNMLVDITENKRVHETNKKLQIDNEQLQQFAFAACHDLQEPLRKITGFASLLISKGNFGADDTAVKYLNKISNSSKRMMNLISDVLTYARESSSNEPMVETDLNEIIENIKADFEFLIYEKRAVFQCDRLPVVKAVPSQTYRLFYNLISNSLKFAKKGVAPFIKITVLKYSTYFKIIVKDNGIGFKQAYADKIFNLFHRLNDKQAYTGSGIGLSLCKKIVENHEGEIFALSEENKGAAFHIKLPAHLLVNDSSESIESN